MTTIAVQERLRSECPDGCGGTQVVYRGQVLSFGLREAAFDVALRDHDGYREVYTRVVRGDGAPPCDDHLVFESRTGPLDADDPRAPVGSTLVDATPDPGGCTGTALTADEARHHPRLDEYWQLHDAVHDAIGEVSAHLAGRPVRLRGPGLRRFRAYAVEAEPVRVDGVDVAGPS